MIVFHYTVQRAGYGYKNIKIRKCDDDDNVNEKYLYSIMYVLNIGQHLSSYSHTNITQKVCPLFFL